MRDWELSWSNERDVVQSRRHMGWTSLAAFTSALGFGTAALGQPGCPDAGTVLTETKISETIGGFGGVLDAHDRLGRSLTAVGDLDGDGVADLAVGATGDDDGGLDRGALWLIYLNVDGSVKTERKISSTAGGFTGPLDDDDRFGVSVTSLGDLDGDGVTDLAVGAPLDDDGGLDRGAVWVLFLNNDGTVRDAAKISDTTGGFGGVLDDVDLFGASVASPGDVDGDGIGDLFVGAWQDDDGGADRGACWVLFLNTDGSVKTEQKISSIAGGFVGPLDDVDGFGFSIAAPGDIDGDGTPDLAAGAFLDDDGGLDTGAVYLMFLNADGTVRSEQKISPTSGGFEGQLDTGDIFGASVAPLSDLDNDGVAELAIGAGADDDGGSDQGALWIVFLNANGTAKGERKISATQGGFGGGLDVDDEFGLSVSSLNDLSGDGSTELAVGATLDDDGEQNAGAVWILTLDACDLPPSITSQPQSVAVTVGEPVAFTVEVGLGQPPLMFQWRRAGQDLTNGGSISGAFTDTLSISSAKAADTGEYDVVITNAFGQITSDTAVLGVRNPNPADLNGDGSVDGADLGLLLQAWAP